MLNVVESCYYFELLGHVVIFLSCIFEKVLTDAVVQSCIVLPRQISVSFLQNSQVSDPYDSVSI